MAVAHRHLARPVAEEEEPRAPGYVELLRTNRPYALLWSGQLVSFFGDWFTMIALLTVVQEITDSAQAVAMVLVARLLPIFLVTPLAGPLVDRFDRRKLMIATDFARAVCVLGLIAAHQAESLAGLFTILVVKVAISGVFIPARTSSVPQVTKPHELPVAMALSGGTWSVMLAFGAAAGGLVTALIGVTGAFAFDTLTYLLSAALIWQVHDLPPNREGKQVDAGFIEGLRYLRDRPYLTCILSTKSVMSLGTGATALLPLFGNGLFPATAGPLFIGLLYASRGIGALIGSLGLRRILGDDPVRLRNSIAPSLLFMAVALVWLYYSPNVWSAAGAFLAIAVGNGVSWVFSGILAQQLSDQEYRGRVFSIEFAVLTLVGSAVGALAGGLVDFGGLTPQEVVLLTAAVMTLAGLTLGVLLTRLAPDD